MEQPQRGTASDHSNNLGAANQMPHVLFREIHKNAFLKKHTSDRRTGFPKKSERVWVVFCVHDDVEAFLEMYPDQKVALTHKPEWFASLANALHVSPSICGHEDEFEFAVTLSTQVIRLAAPSWESMMEWVDTIRNKLRELKILSPKENLYSKMPEQKQPLLPTRDPNSPLPLPPDGPSTLLPGVEPVHLELRNNVAVSESGDGPQRIQRDGFVRTNIGHERRVNVRHEPGVEASFQPSTSQPSDSTSVPQQSQSNAADAVTLSPSSDNEAVGNRSRIGLNRTVSVPESSPAQRIISTSIPTCSNITVIEVSCPTKRNSHSVSECNAFDYVVDGNTQGEVEADDVFVTPPVTPKLNVNGPFEAGCSPASSSAHYEHVFLPNSVVTVDNSVVVHSSDVITLHSNKVSPSPNAVTVTESESIDENSSHSENIPCTSSSANDRKTAASATEYKCVGTKTNEDSGCISQQIQSKLEKVTISGLIPRVPAKASKLDVPKRPHANENVSQADEDTGTSSSSASPSYSQVKKVSRGKVKCEGGSSRSPDHRARLSPLPSRRKPAEDDPEGKSESELAIRKSKHGNRGEAPGDKANAQYRNEVNAPVASTSGNVRSEPRVNPPPKRDADVEPLTATVQPAVGVIAVEDIPLIGGHQRRRRRSSSSEAATSSANNIARGISGADRIRINVPLTQPDGDGRGLDVRNEAEPVNLITKSSSRLTLREQQVMQLRREMMHPGGVRLQLRKKECVASIALVDALSGVWVAGWKQREHPMLYNALHIGDQLISVSDVVVRSAADAQKIIRSSTNIYIELIIRRVPFGRVFALHRSSEGQSLGIVQEGNTAEIKDVIPNSVAARAGLSPKTPSVDGLSLTTWFLTEINGRPLNLFFKDNEVRDRLNAVGKDISVLVQPHDFIKQIKKSLKNIRSYKDYIVQ